MSIVQSDQRVLLKVPEGLRFELSQVELTSLSWLFFFANNIGDLSFDLLQDLEALDLL